MSTEHPPTPSSTVGPYFAIGLTNTHSVLCMAGPNARGERVSLKCRVFDVDNAPVNDAMIEIWQADGQGKYNHPDDTQSKTLDPGCSGFGRAATDEQGSCEFDTIKPGRVPDTAGALQAPHINVGVFARGMLIQLYTRIYFAGDPANEQDAALALVPEDRRGTLMAQPDRERKGGWRFDIHLRGDNETVFFDV
jgi:protocatechuate 3,4-dioxygenase alpha subunit